MITPVPIFIPRSSGRADLDPDWRVNLAAFATVIFVIYMIISLIDWSVCHRNQYGWYTEENKRTHQNYTFIEYFYKWQWPEIGRWFADLV